MKTPLSLSALALPVLLGLGCAHPALNHQLDDRLAQETAVTNRTELHEEADRLIQSAPDLSAEQRTRLSALRDSIRARLLETSSQSLKLRSLLVQDLLAQNYDETEVELIKRRLRRLDEKRISMIFNAVDEAKKILGRQTVIDHRMLEEYLDLHHERLN